VIEPALNSLIRPKDREPKSSFLPQAGPQEVRRRRRQNAGQVRSPNFSSRNHLQDIERSIRGKTFRVDARLNRLDRVTVQILEVDDDPTRYIVVSAHGVTFRLKR